ncbi:calcium-transporting ATPase 1, endoplasmic reticulum-type-like [Hordeum vulgare subsp. vulgare]|uniref:calcium-transporting ATPase 1, endoplasmic reticulum-type-like n=1 Tax=Hordeum vulgare subsp. vulgare TaxID=112509 RepID=UPI001D1A4E86|nr:calcium-transporting ATPase 1, endoplasmic reticulum-type-like [Hordeum vulgare subsp. vulgare]
MAAAGPRLPCICMRRPGSGAAAPLARHGRLAAVREVDPASRPRGRRDPVVIGVLRRLLRWPVRAIWCLCPPPLFGVRGILVGPRFLGLPVLCRSCCWWWGSSSGEIPVPISSPPPPPPPRRHPSPDPHLLVGGHGPRAVLIGGGGAATRARPNELLNHQGPSMLQLVAQQFENTLVRILLAAGAISFVLALFSSAGALMILPFVEALVIFLILVANAAVGVWQETNAEKALEALRQIQSDHAAVLRDAEWEPAFPVRDLVPGDVVMVRVGDKVPADMRVLRLVSSTLRVEQGSLTGETNSVNKTAHAVPADDADIQAKDCMVFAGTTVVNGSAVCLVVHTGMATEIGKIHSQIHEALQEDDDTPLKKKLNEFGETLTNIIGLICILVWLIKVKYFLTFELDGWVPRNIHPSIYI